MAQHVEKLDNGLHAVEYAGALRVLGCLPPHADSGLPKFGTKYETLPRKAWQERDTAYIPVPVLDQGQASACVGFSSVNAFRRAWLLSGQSDEAFSPYGIYAGINGGQDAGAVISDALTFLQKYGCPLAGDGADRVPPRLWYPQDLNAHPAVLQAASRFKIEEAWHLSTFDELGSALTMGFECVCGINVGRNFGQLDADGAAPLPDVVLGGHALHNCGLKFSARKNAWLVHTLNSWSAQWGMGGYCYLTEQHFMSRGDLFAILAVSDDPAETEIDPPSTL